MVVKKLEEAQDREKECQKHRHRLEEENMNLKLMLEQNQVNDPKIKKAVLALNDLLNEMRESSGENMDTLAVKLNGITQELSTGLPSGSGLGKTEPTMQRSPKRLKEMKQLTDEVQKLKKMNEELIGKLEGKNREVDQLLRETRSSGPGAMSSAPQATTTPSIVAAKPDESGVLKYQVPNIDEIRKMEADLKRKSDLLAEVKVLLKQAADRERSILASKEELSNKLKLVLEVDPKTPAEALAKELRQARLTVDRLQCEKKELEHKLESLRQEYST